MDPRIEPEVPFTEAQLSGIEHALGRVLPDDYTAFVRKYGGAFVGGFTDGASELPLLNIMSANQVLAALQSYGDLREEGLLPVAGCELGNLYILDRSNAVHYINYYGGTTVSTKVAATFGELLSRVVVVDE